MVVLWLFAVINIREDIHIQLFKERLDSFLVNENDYFGKVVLLARIKV